MNQSNWKVKSKLALLIALFTLGFSIFALIAFNTLNNLKVNGPYYQRIVQGKDLIADVLPPPEYVIESYLLVLQMTDAPPRAELNNLISRSRDLRRQYNERHAFWQKDTLITDPQIRQAMLVDAFNPAIQFFDVRDNQFFPAVQRGDWTRAKALARGPLHAQYELHRAAVDRVVSGSTALNANVEAEAASVIARRTAWLVALALGIIGLIGLGLGLGMSRSITRPLANTLNSLSVTSAEMAATVEEQERTAVLQSAAAHETTTTMDELDASFTQTAEMVKVAADTAQQANEAAGQGLETVRLTLAGMQLLKSKVALVSEQISNLSEQTAQIGSITRVVGDLANQTNMLALNAAVEAARAGEHGKGFGVVASEIRKLADESRKSAERINGLVEEIKKATDATVMATEEGSKSVEADIRLAEQTAQAFNGIVTSSQGALEAAQQTLLAVPQQVAAVRQVLSAMEDLNRGARETADGLGQTKAGVENLREAAMSLKAMV